MSKNDSFIRALFQESRLSLQQHPILFVYFKIETLSDDFVCFPNPVLLLQVHDSRFDKHGVSRVDRYRHRVAIGVDCVYEVGTEAL